MKRELQGKTFATNKHEYSRIKVDETTRELSTNVNSCSFVFIRGEKPSYRFSWMGLAEKASPNSAFAALRRFARDRKTVERCDFCSAELGDDHQHLIEPERRRLVCVCGACAILFGNQGDAKYRRAPRRILYLPDFRLTDAQWEGLSIPIRLAFFFQSSQLGRVVALYPSPAGATESPIDPAAWDELTQDNPALVRISPDVEGLLVNRINGAGRGHSRGAPEHYIAPIDECFKLVGLIRTTWRGLSGGEKAWDEIGRYFTGLRSRAVEINANQGGAPCPT